MTDLFPDAPRATDPSIDRRAAEEAQRAAAERDLFLKELGNIADGLDAAAAEEALRRMKKRGARVSPFLSYAKEAYCVRIEGRIATSREGYARAVANWLKREAR